MSLLDNIIKIEIIRDVPPSPFPPDGYYQYHYGLSDKLCATLKSRVGVDVIFVPVKFALKPKQIQRFWHNFRKTKSKVDYNRIKMRVFLICCDNDFKIAPEWIKYIENKH